LQSARCSVPGGRCSLPLYTLLPDHRSAAYCLRGRGIADKRITAPAAPEARASKSSAMWSSPPPASPIRVAAHGALYAYRRLRARAAGTAGSPRREATCPFFHAPARCRQSVEQARRHAQQACALQVRKREAQCAAEASHSRRRDARGTRHAAKTALLPLIANTRTPAAEPVPPSSRCSLHLVDRPNLGQKVFQAAAL